MFSLRSKYSILLLLIALTCIQCQSSKRSRFLRREYKAIYIDQFKLTYIRKMLLKGYNNSIAIQEIIKSDHSGFTEPIITVEDIKLIDSLTTIDNQKMIADSSWGSKRAEGSQGKRPLGFIYSRLESKWLDSLAKSSYKLSGLKHERHDY